MNENKCNVIVTVSLTEEQVNRIKKCQHGFQVELWNEFGTWDFSPTTDNKIKVRHRQRLVTTLEFNQIQSIMTFEFQSEKIQ